MASLGNAPQTPRSLGLYGPRPYPSGTKFNESCTVPGLGRRMLTRSNADP
jgi:hypothetical protein